VKVVTVARKPLGESTVAANVVAWDTGAFNVDGIRIGTSADVSSVNAVRKRDYPQSYDGHGHGWGRSRGGLAGDVVRWTPTTGRWPANVVVQHLPGCLRAGEKSVRSSGHYPASRTSGSDVAGASGHVGQSGLAERHMDGEVVEQWRCEPGCPVPVLDEHSGISRSAGGRVANISRGQRVYGGGKGLGVDLPPEDVRGDPGYGDVGGASRFFKQVGGEE